MRPLVLSMDHQVKPKLKNSKTLISEFMSFGLLRPLNRKKPFLISHDFGISGSWSQCASNGWRWRLPMNLKVGRVTLGAPLGSYGQVNGAHGVTRPTTATRFSGQYTNGVGKFSRRSFAAPFRKFAQRNPRLQQQIADTLRLMQDDVFAPALGTHKLGGQLLGLRACSCG